MKGGPAAARRRSAVGCGLAVLFAAAAAGADRAQELERLRAAIDESRDRVARYEREQRGLLETLEALDRAAALLGPDVARARDGAQRARRDLARIEVEGAEAAQQLEATRRAMGARAAALYRAGELGPVQLVFSAGNLQEFLSRVSALRVLLLHDGELLARHREQSERLEQAEREARPAADRLQAAVEELGERSRQLETERATKEKLVARLYRDRAQERAALVELETAARALEETVAGLSADSRGGEMPAGGPPFGGRRGRLAPPVEGRIVRGFGRVVDQEFRTETFRKGIEFEATRGVPVAAVAPGRVRYAGWFRGYGKLVILDHGEEYFTVSGHLAEISVAPGDAVAAGEAIGSVGDTGSLSGPRLYFEIRRGREALDPAEWLASAGAR